MGAIYQEFEREMAGWREKYARQPRREMIALCLLALEREELVSIGYREEIMAERLAAMPIPPEVREIVHHALAWAWKDEEMHAIYIRGAIFKLGSSLLRMRALARQVAGAVAGWATSVRQHLAWRAAPISRASATLTTWVGALLGRLPRAVREHLDYGPFRDFCLFNIEAEKTAWLCWGRLAELAQDMPGLPAAMAEDFRRVQADEARHCRIFEALAASFDDQDRLVPGQSEETLRRKIGEVGEFFLPRRFRTKSSPRNVLGGGGRVWVASGTAPDQKLPLFRRLLDDSLGDRLEQRARALGKPLSELQAVIKPTFMLGYDRRDRSVITDPELVAEAARYLRGRGCHDVAVIEARNIYDRFYQHRTVREVAAYFGIASDHFRIIDASEEQVPHSYFRGMAQYSVARSWRDADFRITFGKMRSHPVELAYLTVGNVEWMGGRCDEFVFAERQAQRETAIMMLLDEFPPDFAILDAYDLAADGLIGVMGCPRPKTPGRLYAGVDALAVDMVAARHMHVNDPRQSSLLCAACHWFGDPSAQIEVMGCDEPLAEWRGPYHNEVSTMLSLLAFPVYVWGSGRGSLFLPAMDPKAFPFIRRETPWQWIARRGMRRLLGLHHSSSRN